MTHTFDIRFARSAGLIGLLEAPANTFRWKGDGQLGIDADGISIAVRRGLLRLFPSTKRFDSANLKEVYREADALRLTFSATEMPPVVVLCWARDSGIAARIVELLPTRQTVEIEHTTGSPAPLPRSRVDSRVVSFIAGAILATTLLLTLQRNEPAEKTQTLTATVPATTAIETEVADSESGAKTALPAAVMPSDTIANSESRPAARLEPAASIQLEEPDMYSTTTAPVSTETAAPAAQRDAPSASRFSDAGPWTVYVQTIDGVVPIVSAMPSYPEARRQLDLFNHETASLRYDRGDTARWWQVSVRIYNEPAFNDPALWPLQEAMLAASRAWRGYLESRRTGGPDQVVAREIAEKVTNRVDLYVR